MIDLLKNDIVHPKTVFVGLGVLSFAFVCQHSAFIIAGSLKVRNELKESVELNEFLSNRSFIRPRPVQDGLMSLDCPFPCVRH